MRKLFFVCMVLAPAASLCASKLLPIGDSITVGQYSSGFTPGAYRAYLETVFTGCAFTGPKSDNAAPWQTSPYHAGWSGITTDWIPSHTGLWATYAEQATHALLLIGTNDLNIGRGVPATVAGIESAARSIFAVKPSICLVIGSLGPHRDGSLSLEVSAVNSGILGLRKLLASEGYNVAVADTGSAFYPVATNMVDQLHPSVAGYVAMAEKWKAAIQQSPRRLTSRY